MAIHNPGELIKSAEDALLMLKEGNARFIQNKLISKDSYEADRKVLAKRQRPFAAVLCCADSRAAPEIYFDQKMGDIFSIRNAGNVVDSVVMGSIEYATEHLRAPLVVVIGHTCCGAVTAACQDGELPTNIQRIVKIIKPSVREGDSVAVAVRNHAIAMAKKVGRNKIIKHLGTKVVPAYYNIATGVVTWL